MNLRGAFLVLLALAAAACGGDVPGGDLPLNDTIVDLPFTDSTFEVWLEGNDGSKPGDVLLVGQSSRLIADVLTLERRSGTRGSSAHGVTGATVRWRSLAPDVLAVDSAGRVHALAPGSAGVVAAAYLPGAGDSPAAVDTMPFRVVPPDSSAVGPRFTEVSAHTGDFEQTCGITEQGNVACLSSPSGEGGYLTESRGVFVLQAPAGTRFHGVATGGRHLCALDPGGRAFCWGSNEMGERGRPSVASEDLDVPAEPVATDARFTRLDAGVRHTCGVTTEGAVLCWGEGRGGALGARAADRCRIRMHGENRRSTWQRVHCSRTPRPVSLPGRAVDVAAGDSHTCALTADGALYCWGYLYNIDFDSPRPRRVQGADARLVRIASGSQHLCALDAAGSLFCWGRNWAGQVGAGDPKGAPRLTRVPGLPPVRAVTAGAEHTCAITVPGAAFCWGENRNVQLGGGRPLEQGMVRVAGELAWRSITAGASHTCGVTTRGALYCWGAGLAFRREPGGYHDQPEPFAVAGWR